ncbi:hypothetical protein [Aequorivita lipolytica]|uniref:Uncharacterized protein n=1 Tax=Aequorivita lipolytica TaxID=153267 RepID=A0A5C6YLD9_9FLAO|nr:hypothetical protein [Aequorivita lipolytica]TXD68350.1 hypothetical protein ESV24_12880 [Aequorivita lipolytica]SRX53375.1 hypothetical protein AEQU2_02605 [Aequorivita lipolytica]
MRLIKYIIYTIVSLIVFGLIVQFVPYYSEYPKGWFYDAMKWVFSSKWYVIFLLFLVLAISYKLIAVLLGFVFGIFAIIIHTIKKILSFDYECNPTLKRINNIIAIVAIIAFTLNYWGLMYLLYQGFDIWYFLSDLIFYFLVVFGINSVASNLNRELDI